MRINLAVTFCRIKFSTPLISVSGIVVNPKEIIKLAQEGGVGGVTTKSISIFPRKGHPAPQILSFKIGFINSVGLKNPGVKKGKEEILSLKKFIQKPIIVSIFASRLSEFSVLAKEVIEARPDLIEVNLSCPNVESEFGKPFATDPFLAAAAILEVKRVVKKIPVIAKLSPNTPELKRVAFEVEKAGADAISAINTLGPGMIIDIRKKKPILGNKMGGVSGPAIKPIAIRCVYEVYETVKIPIIGIGGITDWKDAIEMMMAGASLIGIGSAIYLRGYKVFKEIEDGIKDFLKKEGYTSVSQLVGLAH